MDLAGTAAAAWHVLGGLQREPWFATAAYATIMVLLLFAVRSLIRIRVLKRRLAANAQPAHTLYQAVVTTRQARTMAAASSARRFADGATALDGRPPTPVLRGKSPSARPEAAPACLVKIYVDGSNLQENWEHIQQRRPAADQAGVDWDALPRYLIDDIARRPAFAGRQIIYGGAHVYGSYFPNHYYDLLERIETGAIKSLPVPYMAYRRGRVRDEIARHVPAGHDDRDAEIERQLRSTMLTELEQWRRKNETQIELLTRGLPNRFGYRSFPFERRVRRDLKKARYNSSGVPQADEKGLDVHCCTDLMADAAFDMFDVAVIVTNDSDFVPAITFVNQELAKPVIQLGPRTMSEAVRAACSGFIDLEDFVLQVNTRHRLSTVAHSPPAPSATAAHPAAPVPVGPATAPPSLLAPTLRPPPPTPGPKPAAETASTEPSIAPSAASSAGQVRVAPNT